MGDCLIILGMHRSGTSAMAGAVRLLGVDLGARLMGPRKSENERGFFEDVDLHDFHERQLALFGSAWHDLGSFPEERLLGERAHIFREELAELLQQKFGDAPMWGVKDPRLCRLLPLWLPVLERLGQTPHCVLIHRHPEEVAASLAVRDGFSAQKSGRVWLAHCLAAERHTRSLPRVVVSLNQLLKRPLETLERIGKELELEWPVAPGASEAEIREFLSPSLRHHRAETGSVAETGLITPLLERMHQALSRWSDADEPAPAVFDRIADDFEELLQPDDRILLEHIGQLTRGLSQRLEAVQGQLHERTEWLRSQSREVESQGRLLGEQSQQLERLRGAVESEALLLLEERIEEGSRALGRLEQQLAHEQETLKESLQEVDERAAVSESKLRESLAVADALGALRSEMVDTRAGLGGLRTALSEQTESFGRFFAAHGRIVENAREIGESVAKGSETLSGVSTEVDRIVLELRHERERREEAAQGQDETSRWLAASLMRHQLRLDEQFQAVEALRGQLERLGALEGRQEALETELARVAEHGRHLEATFGSHLEVQQQQLTEALEGVHRVAEQTAGLDQRTALLATQVDMLWTSKPWRAYVGLGKAKRLLRLGVGRGARAAAEPASAGSRAAETAELVMQSNLEFEPVDEPVVSILVPVLDSAERALATLAAIRAAATDVPYEVWITAPGKAECRALSTIPNLRVARLWRDRGLAHSFQVAARKARGEYLVFLPAASALSEQWLDRLMDTFVDFPDAAIVGARLLDAGGSIAAEGTTIDGGGRIRLLREGDPSTDTRFDYAKETPAASGCGFALPRRRFRGRFRRPHWEGWDYRVADLALRLGANGSGVYCQPCAQVTLPEGISVAKLCGVDAADASLSDRRRFQRRWQARLTAAGATGEALVREVRPQHTMLVLDHRQLTPDKDAGSVRMWNLLRVLRTRLHFDITFLPANLLAMKPYTERLRASGVEVVAAPQTTSVLEFLTERGREFDCVILSRAHVAEQLLEATRTHCPEAKLIFDTVDLQYLRGLRQAKLEESSGLRQAAGEMKSLELRLAASTDATLVVSPFERDLLRKELPEARVHVVRTVHALHGCRTPFEERKDFFFIGGYEHPPNVDAARWLVTEILPLVQRELPEIHLYIVGSKPPDEVRALARDGVTVTGYVEDVEPFFCGCRLSVAPLRYGAGVKGKVNHSMAYGLPCVVTSAAAEGMEFEHRREVLVADRADKIAAAIVELYGDRELWSRLSEAGLENVRRHFSFDAAERALKEVLRSLAHPLAAPTPAGLPPEAEDTPVPLGAGVSP